MPAPIKTHEELENTRKRKSGARRGIATQLLVEVGLFAPLRTLHCYPYLISGGQKQRAMFAMSLAAEPELLVSTAAAT